MKNKRLVSSALAFITLLSTASCAQSGERSETTQPALTAASTTTTTAAATLAEEDKQALAEVETTFDKLENGTVKFLSSWDINPADGKPKQVSLEMFETNYGGKIEYVPCTWETRYEALGKMIAAGDSPDMFSAGDLDCFPQGAASKMFLPLDDYVDFDSELWAPMKEVNDQFVFQGKHYVGATSTDAGVVMIYNQKTIEENGLADPAELLEEGNYTSIQGTASTAEKLKITAYSFFEESLKSGGIGEKLLNMLYSNGYKGKFVITAVEGFVKQSSVESCFKKYNLDREGMRKIIDMSESVNSEN